MAKEYIEREAATRILTEAADAYGTFTTERGIYLTARGKVQNIPAADVAPVVHGRWIKDNDSFQTDDYYCCYFDHTCSECGKIVNDRYKLPNYCPNCGAKIDGGE